MAAQKAKGKGVTPVPKAKAAVKAVPRTPLGVSRQPRITTDVQAAVVDEVPTARDNSLRTRYARVLHEIRVQVGPGKPVKVAEYVSRDGARVVKRDLEAGRRLCDGDAEDWQLDARRLEEGSALYATLLPDRRGVTVDD